jgi:tryptophan-rich hypothetical protein
MARKIQYSHLLGSKWTAQQDTLGWRHFQVITRKNQGSWIFAELQASCDDEVRVWVNAQLLKDRQLWLPGWRSLAEIQAAQAAWES